jgi:hypothetical protein
MNQTEALYHELGQFINGSAAGLLQVLVSAAERRTFNRIVNCPTYPVPAKTLGLSSVVRQLREGIVSGEVHVPTLLAQLYETVRDIGDRKRRGQFFTSARVANWVLRKTRLCESEHICDAGAGTAVFADAALRTNISIGSYIGIENDPILALCAAHVLEGINAPASYKIWYTNFLTLRRQDFAARGLNEPTLVISNPPFVRFHNLKGRAQIRTTLKTQLGVMLSSYSGSGAYFLLRAAEIVGSAESNLIRTVPNKRLFFLLPREAAGAAHSRRLREDLNHLYGWTWQNYRIPVVQSGINRHKSNALALLFVAEQKSGRTKLNSRAISVPVVRDVLQIKRGISTGRNDFFVLTDQQIKEWKIPKRYLQAVLPTRIPIVGTEFTSEDWEHFRAMGRACWLLTLPVDDVEDFDISVQEYLKEGIKSGVHSTPTAKSFRAWFSLPIPRTPPDVFVTYLFRGAPRFILNSARVLHLTNILGGRFVASATDLKYRRTIVDSLNQQAETWITRNPPGREYKGGLRKIEPRELSMLPINSLGELIHQARAATASTGSLFE